MEFKGYYAVNLRINRFEDIIAWQKAKEMSIQVYKSFDVVRDFGFKDQIQRASVSVMNNIAEGFERQTDNEFRQGLYIAKGSCGEVRSMVYLASELNIIDADETEILLNLSIEISKVISGLIKSINNP